MAATESPLVNSPANMMSAFSPYTEFSLSPNSPAPPNTPGRFQSLSARSSTDSNRLLRPKSMEGDGGLSPNVAPSPSDMVGPSPVTSNGTETTDIEDDASEEVESATTGTSAEQLEEKDPERATSSSLNTLTTNLPEHVRRSSEEEPASVIHAPQGYMNFANTNNANPPQKPPAIDRSTPKPFQTIPPSSLRVEYLPSGEKTMTSSPVSPPPISTNVRPVSFGFDNSTPRAQTWHEVELAQTDKPRHRSSSASSLEGIPEDYRESDDTADFSDAFPPQDPNSEVTALKTALHECWTLCNTLARMSSIHRERIFSYSGTKDAHEKAWKACWKLCQKLYDSRDDQHDLHVGPTLDLCRDFCQALFDVRRKGTDIADGVLRVSFELNNHLFNTHDRNLPDAFRERTLDFYITLCHRLMKQRSELAEETDSLLRACWGLAEMLFSLRQNRRDDKAADEELLGSAVQACWELCDLFREGWTQVRPERGTPRPSQTTFSQSLDQLSRSSHHSSSHHSSQNSIQGYAPHSTHSNHSQSETLKSHLLERVKPRPVEPETPTTEFEDTPISPEESSPTMPNILVLGTSDSSRAQGRWSSNSSNLSGYSQGSAKTSSTIKTAGGTEDPNLIRLKILILKAAMNVGFQRTSPSSSSSSSTNPAQLTSALQSYVKSLPASAFGKLQWHSNLLASYKDLVSSDPTFRSTVTLPEKGKRATAPDVAKSVTWMMRSGKYAWLKDLYRLVFGFGVEEAEGRGKTGITV